MSTDITLSEDSLVGFSAALLRAAGVQEDDAICVAAALVAADLEGVASHGVMLLPMYLERLSAGSVDPVGKGKVVSQKFGSISMDAGNALGQVTANQAATLAMEAVGQFGYGAVSVRNGFHFGAAGYWAERIATVGLIGFVMCNTRPLMPPPGGSVPVVGNNPIAIALPSNSGVPLLLDLALSEAAMGKIRNAAAAGKPIPLGWATDTHGRPTTDAEEAIKGMLLPTGGPKGFGLAVIVELLTGGLSGGGTSDAVRGLYGNAAEPYNCSHFFLALDPECFGGGKAFQQSVGDLTDRIRATPPAPGIEAVMAPGDPARRNRQRSEGKCTLPAATYQALVRAAADHGINAKQFLN